MTKKEVLRWLRQPVSGAHVLVAFLIVVGGLGIGGMIAFHIQITVPKPQPPPHYNINPSIVTPPAYPTAYSTTYTFTQNTFKSSDLGISFTWDGKQVQVKEIGDKVYLYPWDTNSENGKFVEVFSKDPQDSITEAITKRFLQGYSKMDCLIETYTNPHAPATYQYADIRVPVGATDTLTTFMDRAALCPPNTVSGNENIYFLMDTAHPKKLLYFKLGQDNIGSGIHIKSGSTDIELTWDESIKFLDRK